MSRRRLKSELLQKFCDGCRRGFGSESVNVGNVGRAESDLIADSPADLTLNKGEI